MGQVTVQPVIAVQTNGQQSPLHFPAWLGARTWGSWCSRSGPLLSPAISFVGQALVALSSLRALALGRMVIQQLPYLLLCYCLPQASGSGTLALLLPCSILYMLRCLPPATQHLEKIVINPLIHGLPLSHNYLHHVFNAQTSQS